ncbi:FAD:protein FMN transferase [Teichococcus oryzae]|uniref:FAD:protein FMN transferase n=1 Tax=Teichococcus oryzae TaxID=1608942 RepID=A0A5B2TA55_9PROT|nr:FAD:protein FMN transferase [Pseudoroseomonas oryzae]KAA2211456.1 FAD:protein FMN transferase [Pseudoroseomonas oryzae]
MQPAASRRRVLGIFAAAAGFGLPGIGATRAEAPLLTWTGPVLGATGSIMLHHPDRIAAERLVARCVAEIRRLEALFNLWQAESQLSALNRRGMLVAPAPEMVDLLTTAKQVAAWSDGVFDPTVQPLWLLYRDHFAAEGADPQGPSPHALAEALSLVDHRRLLVSSDRILLTRRGMAVTLNGIAQGYLTDRIVDLLRGGGVAQTLVDMGEARGVGRHPSGRPWRASLENPAASDHPWAELDLTDRALATSADSGFVFDGAGRFTHLLDPCSGQSPRRYRTVSVLAPEATMADAFSTAFALMPEPAIAAALCGRPDVEAHLLRPDGSTALLHGT